MADYRSYRCLATLTAMLATTAARAAALIVQPHAGVGIQNYELVTPDFFRADANSNPSFSQGVKLRDHLEFATVGLTGTYRRLFIDVTGQRSNTGTDQAVQFQGNLFIPGATGLNHHLDSRFTREEYNLTAGWGVTPSFSTYVGYKHARTITNSVLTPLYIGPPASGVLLLMDGTKNVTETYGGLFVGATYSIPVASWNGAFSLQSSLARLNGTLATRFKGNLIVVGVGGVFVQSPYDAPLGTPFDGTSQGLNLGLSWTGNLRWLSQRLAQLSYTIGADRSEYKFDSGQSNVGFEETATRIRLDLRYQFGGAAR